MVSYIKIFTPVILLIISACAVDLVSNEDSSPRLNTMHGNAQFGDLTFDMSQMRWVHPLGNFSFKSCESERFYCITDSWIPFILPKDCNELKGVSSISSVHAGDEYRVFALQSPHYFAITPVDRNYLVYVVNGKIGVEQIYFDVSGGTDLAAIIVNDGVLAAGRYLYRSTQVKSAFGCTPILEAS